MPKKTYEATFYYQVTLVREGTVEIDVPEGSADDYNPFANEPASEVQRRYESLLGEPEMLVDDETPEGERLTDILLHDPASGEVFRVTRIEGETNLVPAPLEVYEDEDEE